MVGLFHFTDALIHKMRWRAFYIEKDLNNELINKPRNMNVINSKLNKVGRLPFPKNKCAPVCLKLIPFEAELFELINNIDFKNNATTFQKIYVMN